MHMLDLPSRTRIRMPEAKNPDLQSIYIFNMYRSASSLTEAIAESIAVGSPYTKFNVVQALDEAGVGLIDHQDRSRAAVFIDDSVNALDTLTQYGGYIFYGFREIPFAFSEHFAYIGASVIVVRDLRDIAISQYNAVRKHVVAGASGNDILMLRQTVKDMSLEAFILSENTINFVRRIANCYRSLVEKGIKILRYEDFMTSAGFDSDALAITILSALHPYVVLNVSRDAILSNLKRRILQSPDLQGHSTGGKIEQWKEISNETLNKLNAALNSELALFGYV